jgi:tetratricopeptide (TPR) repeat protein
MAKSGTGRSGVIPSGRILPGLGAPGRPSGVPDELPHSDLEAFLARRAGAKREVRSPPRPFGTSPAQEREAQRLAADGVRLMERGRHVEAVAVLQRSLSLNPAVAEVQRHLGAALIAAGRPDQAVGPLTNAIRRDPSFAMAHVSLGFTFETLGYLERRSPGIGTRSHWSRISSGLTSRLAVSIKRAVFAPRRLRPFAPRRRLPQAWSPLKTLR